MVLSGKVTVMTGCGRKSVFIGSSDGELKWLRGTALLQQVQPRGSQPVVSVDCAPGVETTVFAAVWSDIIRMYTLETRAVSGNLAPSPIEIRSEPAGRRQPAPRFCGAVVCRGALRVAYWRTDQQVLLLVGFDGRLDFSLPVKQSQGRICAAVVVGATKVVAVSLNDQTVRFADLGTKQLTKWTSFSGTVMRLLCTRHDEVAAALPGGAVVVLGQRRPAEKVNRGQEEARAGIESTGSFGRVTTPRDAEVSKLLSDLAEIEKERAGLEREVAEARKDLAWAKRVMQARPKVLGLVNQMSDVCKKGLAVAGSATAKRV
jgi:hypothetical protein